MLKSRVSARNRIFDEPSLFNLWRTNSMDNIIKNPGFQHIVEKSLMCLDRKSIAIFRSVNRDCKRITDSPTFYLEKILQEKPPQAMAKLPKRLKLRFFGKSFPQFVEKTCICSLDLPIMEQQCPFTLSNSIV